MMTEEPSAGSPNFSEERVAIQSLRELMDIVTGRAFQSQLNQEDAGLAETVPFPFMALVGQTEMKLALLISIINPLVSGVLLIGPRGTGKSTAVRSMIDLLPTVTRSACYYGCLPEDVEAGGMDAVCPDCARKYGEGQPLTRIDRGRLVELPLNARLEDVIGGWDDRAAAQNKARLKSGILKQANLNVLYIDEVNLLADEITNAILDAAAQGTYTVRRGPLSSTYRARFTLIGSMNPEEGNLRPQIIDRFGLRVLVRGLDQPQERSEAYHRSRAYRMNPRGMAAHFNEDTQLARAEIQAARELLPEVAIPEMVALTGTRLTQRLGIDSLRAEMTLFEAARALAAADGRSSVSLDDLKTAAPLALRLRQSPFMIQYFQDQGREEQRLSETLSAVLETPDLSSKEGQHGGEPE